MKTLPNAFRILSFSVLMIFGGVFLQSCSQANDVQPIGAPTYLVTVKIKDISSGNSDGQSQTALNFRITSSTSAQSVILDSTITGDCTYNFNCAAGTSIKAALSSVSSFNSSIEIDINGRKDAYHSGTCPGNEYDLTDYIGE